ncbi:MAG: DUF4430 domain-containing protein [Eubacterium sp.]
MKILKKFGVVFLMLFFAVTLFAGCNDPLSELTGEASGEEVVELADNTPVPDNGVVTAAQFRSIAGKDRTVTFIGKDVGGIQYDWTYNGKGIKNADDQSLKIEFITKGEGLEAVKAAAGGASNAVGIKIPGNKGLITVPQLTLTMPEKWDADTAAFCKKNGDGVVKMSNVTFDNSAAMTKLTMNVVETGGEYYIVAGKTIAPEPSAQPGATTDNGGTANSADSPSGGSTGGNTCTLSISCSSILNNMGNLTPGKADFVPSNGSILGATTVSFNEGESVHDVLQRVCREKGIHMESTFTPAYNSAYVEGINQLYEFDCGELSGWMYNVNGWFPNYGCSQYSVKNGDVINWVYTCDLGRDVGDNSMW